MKLTSSSVRYGLLVAALVLSGTACAQIANVPAIPYGTKAYRDLPYVTNGHERQKLDLYIPEKADGRTPLVIWIHGGGWASGDKAGCPPLNAGFTKRGYAAASD